MKIKKWEIYLAVFVVLLFCLQLLLIEVIYDQKALSEKLIRMHVIANSDSPEDQSLKLEVRDAVNAYLSEKLSNCSDTSAAAEIIMSDYEQIENVAESTLLKRGCGYPVGVILSAEFYPTRHYEDFSLPAGEYSSLQIKIGDAEGENWWCVVFPPLCTSAVTEDDLSEMDLTEDEIDLITSDDGGVVFKFGILELIHRIKMRL